VLGGLPTHVGLVWTDVGFSSAPNFGAGEVTFEAFDAGGASLGVFGPFLLGDGLNSGETAEDRFLGVVNANGITSIRMTMPSSTDWSADHLQYGRAAPAPVAPAAPNVIPEGTPVFVALKQTCAPGRARTGEVVAFEVVSDVRVADGQSVIVPKGTPAFGAVAESRGAGAFGKPGRLRVTCDYVLLADNTRVALRPGTAGLGARGRGRGGVAFVSGTVVGLGVGFVVTLADTFTLSGDNNTSSPVGTIAGLASGFLFASLWRGGNVTLPEGKTFRRRGGRREHDRHAPGPGRVAVELSTTKEKTMNRLARTRIASGLTFALLVVAPGCGGGGGDRNASLVGTWLTTATGTPGKTVPCPGEVQISQSGGLTQTSACGANDTLDFARTGSFVSQSDNGSGKSRSRGSWKLDGNTLTLTITESADDDNGNGVFDADEIEVRSPPGSVSLRLTFTSSNTISVLFAAFSDLKILTRQ
jgi:hypothetical protein